MLKEPGTWGNFRDVGAGGETSGGGTGIFVRDVTEGSEGDETKGFSEGGWVDLRNWSGRMDPEFPADLIGHPVANTGTNRLI
jgi:hypothetical protein